MFIQFIIPCYNEEKILEKNTLKLFDFLNQQNFLFNWSLTLLINGSTDNSERIAKELKNNYQKIDYFLVEESGKGNALKKFFNHSSADFFFYMDVDLAVSLNNINDVIAEIEKNNYDLIIGSRLKIGSTTDRSFFRELSSRLYILISKTIIKHNFSDLQCGFKLIKKEAWKKISPFIVDKKWFFDTELLIFANLFNLKVKEIPVNWSENRYEKRKSKVKLLNDSMAFIKSLLKLKKRLKTVVINKINK